ncbi:MAG: pyridoxamine 5'-phosphate oxidase family protein [Chloroflexota bacterium]
MTPLSPEVQQRLAAEANIWLATVRPDGRPHLTPVWFAWHGNKLYACIEAGSVKARNLRQNPRLSLALENGSQPVIGEGTAALVSPPWPDAVVAIFQAKYEWDITTDGQYDTLVEITPGRWLSW